MRPFCFVLDLLRVGVCGQGLAPCFRFRTSKKVSVRYVKHDQLTQLLTPVIEALGYECIGVEYSPHRSNALVRIYIDRLPDGITVDDCERVSREVSATLDVDDPIPSHYTLEVSSPGLDRPLFSPAQFAAVMGEMVKLSTNLPLAGRRRFNGRVLEVTDSVVALDQDGQRVEIAHDNIQKARLVPSFDGETFRPHKGGNTTDQ